MNCKIELVLWKKSVDEWMRDLPEGKPNKVTAQLKDHEDVVEMLL